MVRLARASASVRRLTPARSPSQLLASPFLLSSRKFSTSPVGRSIERAKAVAGLAAVERCLRPSHGVVGIGSGSTVIAVVDAIKRQRDELAHQVFIPTGYQSRELIIDAGLRLGDIDDFPSIDITFDGADDVDRHLNAIKGGGACHLREKVVAERSKHFVLVADWRKQSDTLGGGLWKQGVPIEVVPFAAGHVMSALGRITSSGFATLRMGGAAKAGPVVTDNGNFVVDATFSPELMANFALLLRELKALTGVVEVGLFVGMANEAFFGHEDGEVTHVIK